MKILVLNGSPKGERSNTFKLTKAFLGGLGSDNIVHIENLVTANISHCTGCFGCWTKSPGKCVIQDDMEELREKYRQADLIIWSFPLYYYSMPSKIKAFMDRLLPLNHPIIVEDESGFCNHPPRYDVSNQHYILISSCGFCNIVGNYDSLIKQFEIIYPKNLEKILCAEGELFSVPQLRSKTEEYLSLVEKAGQEYIKTGKLSEGLKENLSAPMFPKEAFIEMANASWEISDCGQQAVNDGGRRFLRQMSAIYQKSSYKNSEPAIIEFDFLDTGEKLQLKLDKEKCILLDSLEKYNTKIETSLTLWKDISMGNISGEQALFDRKYKVTGDFSLMLKLGEYFGTKDKDKKQENQPKTNMIFMLAPWIIFWTLAPIYGLYGGIIAILSAVTIPIFAHKSKMTVYDKLTHLFVTGISLIVICGISIDMVLSLSYIIFGIMWLASVFCKVPVTAHYSCNEYGGEAAFENQLFIYTNKILTVIWAIFYLAMAVIVFFTMKSPLKPYIPLISGIFPMVLGAFTIWFSKWYPAYYAKGRK